MLGPSLSMKKKWENPTLGLDHLFPNFSKDVRLPVQMQRAMAAEAESNRNARAKV